MNPFGFLGNLGSAIGGGLKAGFGKLNEFNMAGDDDDTEGGGIGSNPATNRRNVQGMLANALKRPELMKAAGAMAGGEGGEDGGGVNLLGKLGPGGTAGFNPAAADSLPKLGRPLGGESGLINRPEPMPSTMPQLQRPEIPRFEPIRDGADVSANLPMGNAEASPLSGQMIAERPVPTVRPPDFLGRKGATMDDTPLNHERYAYDNQYMQDGHHPRRWQDIAMTALHGANEGFKSTGDWRGALAGAGTGAAGAAINPLMARDYRFNQEQLPRIEASRKEAERGQDRQFEMQKRGADLEGLRARTNATIAGTKDAELVRRQQEANIAKTQADTQAKLTGKPQKFLDYNPETQQYVTAFKYPDGHVEYEGPSGDAQLKLTGFENQKTIGRERNEAGMSRVVQQGKDAYKRVQAQQGGMNYRAGMSQSGQNARQKERLGAQYGDVPPVGSVPTSARQRFIQRAMDEGWSQQEAEAHANKKGMK